MMINPFSQVKELLNKEIDFKIFPLKDFVDQYQGLEKERWKDLDLTTYFLDTVVDILELKIRYFFFTPSIKKFEKEINYEEKFSRWREVKKYLEEKEEKGIKVFWRNRKIDFFLNEDEKINLKEIYYSFIKEKEYKPEFLYLSREKYSIEEKMEELLRKIEGRISFSEIVEKASKIEKVYYFLALCELASQGKIKIYQEEFLGEIILEKYSEYARL